MEYEPDAIMQHRIEDELTGREGAWFVCHTELIDSDAAAGARLETLRVAVGRARASGYFPAGPIHYAKQPALVQEEVDHARLAFVLDEEANQVQAFMNFSREGTIRTASAFRHRTPLVGLYDLLLADAEALAIDVAGLSLALAEVVGYTGEVRFRIEAVVPDGRTARLRAVDDFDGFLREPLDCPTSMRPVCGTFALPDPGGQWRETLYEVGEELARQFRVPGPQLIPPPDVEPSFDEVLRHRVNAL